jgi:hypothetical protein
VGRPRRKKILLAAIALAALGIALGAKPAVEAALTWRFQPEPRALDFPAPKERAEAVRQDLETLGQLPDLDRSFSAEARDRFQDERAKLLAAAATLSPQALEMQVSRLTAIADNGHTTVGRRLRRLPRIPVRMMWFAEGLYVVRADEANARLVGARVERINGKTPEELLADLAPYVSGPPEHARATVPLFMESPYALAGVWPEMSPEREKLELTTLEGESIAATLEPVAPDEKSPYVDPTRNLSPERMPKEAAPWANLLSERSDLPLVLREPDASLYVKKLGEDGLYIHLAAVTGDDRGPLSEQLAALLDGLDPAALRYAVLDLRFDGGGDYTNTLSFTKELPRRIAADGKLFILTDNATFSAAVVTAARAKYFGGARATIIGERMGDRERFWAESGKPLELPHSKILVYFATGYHDWNEGCGVADLARCFWLNLAFDVPAGSLAPDKAIAWKFADYRDGVDTVMKEVAAQAAALVRERR